MPRFTLKDGNTFLLADALGDIQGSDDGLFTNDTRVLSRFERRFCRSASNHWGFAPWPWPIRASTWSFIE